MHKCRSSDDHYLPDSGSWSDLYYFDYFKNVLWLIDWLIGWLMTVDTLYVIVVDN